MDSGLTCSDIFVDNFLATTLPKFLLKVYKTTPEIRMPSNEDTSSYGGSQWSL